MARLLIGIFISLIISLGNVYAVPLKVEQAFAFSYHLDAKNQVILNWDIAPGYYLYRNQIHIDTAPGSQASVEHFTLPEGIQKSDELHGKFQAYTGNLVIPLTLKNQGLLGLKVSYQGCSMEGVCYPPVKKNIQINITQTPVSDQDYATQVFDNHNFFLIMLSFLGMGLLLAFTPCVLPMIPILSSIIVGHGEKISTLKAFTLSLAYVLGMAITYAIAGVLVASIGSNIQIYLQQTWIILLFSGVFVLLALSLFGLYELRLPNRLQQRVINLSNHQKSGNYFGVFTMGALSTLIVSPCVSAPLVGVLGFIGHTGNMMLGGLALLSLGLGMGIPLLLIGTSAGKLLPKAGAWMDNVKKIFGFLMLGLAIWMLQRVLSGPTTLFLWSLLAISLAIFSLQGSHWIKWTRPLVLIYGAILMTGAVMGNSDPFHPLENWSGKSTQSTLAFTVLKTMPELDQQLTLAKQKNKTVMLDFYAKWCNTCVIIDNHVFSRKEVQQALTNFVLLRVDVTDNNAFDQEVMKRFGVNAPPVMIFFNAQGNELIQNRLVGEIDANKFLTNLSFKEMQSATR